MTRRDGPVRVLAGFLLWFLGACNGAFPGTSSTRAEEGHADEQGEGDEHGEGGEHGENLVRLSEQAIARSGIRVAPVVAGGVAATLEVPAEIRPDHDRVAHVAPLVAGQLREVRADVGDTVSAGQTMAVLRSVDLGNARAEYRRARAMLDVAEANFARRERLRKEGISSERELLEARLRLSEARAELEAARARLQVFGVRGGSGPDLDLRAPIDGVVVERHATRGETVGPEDNLFVVADTRRVWIVGRVYEQDVSSVETGMDATLTLPAFPGRSWVGTISFVATTLDEETRSLAVRVEIDNPDGALRLGLFGTLRIRRSDADAEPLPVVPDGAVQDLRGRPVVFVPAEAPNTFRAVPIVPRRQASGMVEILDGLSVDDRVVVDGAFVLKSQLLRSELGEGHAD